MIFCVFCLSALCYHNGKSHPLHKAKQTPTNPQTALCVRPQFDFLINKSCSVSPMADLSSHLDLWANKSSLGLRQELHEEEVGDLEAPSMAVTHDCAFLATPHFCLHRINRLAGLSAFRLPRPRLLGEALGKPLPLHLLSSIFSAPSFPLAAPVRAKVPPE
jgi:hypothetical protein